MRHRLVAVTTLAALALVGPAAAQAPAPGPREHVPYDPAREPALRAPDDVRRGAEQLRAGQNPLPDIIRPVRPGVYQLGTILLDVNARRVVVPGRVNMTQGIIEYLAVMDRRGKLHESVLALDAQPSLLQLALILLGLEPGEFVPGDVATKRPPSLASWGDVLVLSAEWERGGAVVRVPAESLVYNRETRTPLAGNRWHFTGSFFARGGFVPDMTGSVVATWLDYRAMVNASAQAKNPYGGEGLGYEVNTALVPPVDTPVRLIFEPAPRGAVKR